MESIPAGKFMMGSAGIGENYDERPAHVVAITYPFYIAATEITNKQYERFDPSHQKYRGKNGLSIEDDEPVVYVNYNDATAFCTWLSGKEKKQYRLPTEAEWEYACRAGSYTAYAMNDALPKEYFRNQEVTWTPKRVSLTVAQTKPNSWNLYDMHGNVEEWCYDWYGAYVPGVQENPLGRAAGLYRVTRGGSHSTPARYLRSANRSAMIPEDKNWLVGFRIVEAPLAKSIELPATPPPANSVNVKQVVAGWSKLPKAVFLEPINFINEPICNTGTPFYAHNHCPAISWCPNGDLLAVWFSTDEESGREMVILGSRLRAGNNSWDPASLFLKVPDRNMTGSSLFYDNKGTMYHMNGVETAGSWQNLAMVLRTSKDNGASWSAPQLADSEHRMGNQVIAGMLHTRQGWLIQAGDAVPGGEGGSAVHISEDNGKTWHNPSGDTVAPVFSEGKSGGVIAGIHTGIVELKDGSLMAFGRGNNISDEMKVPKMPLSISKDSGRSWTYHASEFPPIAGGQRLVLRRLNEGAILFVSFTNHPDAPMEIAKGMMFKDASGKDHRGYGLFAALSFDEGKTWPVKKLLSDGRERFLNGGAWTGFFKTDLSHAEPKGYLAATQTPDDIIHLISSSIHYRFNLQWLMQ